MEPNAQAVRAQIDAELTAKGWRVPSDKPAEKAMRNELLDAMTMLVVGILRESTPLAQQMEAVTQDQVIGWLVAAVTQISHPEETAPPSHVDMLRSLFEQAGEASPEEHVLVLLVGIASFAIYRTMTPTGAFKIVAIWMIGEAFRAGRKPPASGATPPAPTA